MKKQSVSTRFLSILLIAILLCQIFVPLPAAAQEADKSASNLSNTPAVSSDVIDLPVQADITLSESLLLDSPKTPVKKITVTSGKNLSFIDQNQTISSEFYLDTEVEYDTVSVTYMSSNGIEMKSESFVSETLADGKMTISFVPLNDKIGTSIKDVRNYSEDTILANVSYWKDEIVEATEAIQIHTLSTPYGTFVSEVDPIINKRNYNRYLLRNEIIDEYTYEDLNLEFHYFGEEREDVTYQMADFSSLVTMAEKTAITNALSDRYVTSDTGAVTLSTTEDEIKDYVDITYDIVTSDSGETFTVSGRVYWYDNAGIKRPAYAMKIEVIDFDTDTDDILGTVVTNMNGYFSTTVENQTGIKENGCDIFLRVYAGNDQNMVRDTGDLGQDYTLLDQPDEEWTTLPYYFNSGIYSNLVSSKFDNYAYASSNSLVSKAFSIGNALVYGFEYEKYINGGTPVRDISIKAHFPHTITEESMSLPFFERGRILITEGDYAEWDTILHEYGHIVEDKLDFYTGVTNLELLDYTHYPQRNQTDTNNGDKQSGLNISWSEGWASYYSICVRKKYDLDLQEFPGTSTTGIWGHDLITESWYGEDNELAVAAVFLNLVTQGLFTEQELWALVKENKPKSFAAFSNLIIGELSTASTISSTDLTELNRYFALLEKHNFSAKNKQQGGIVKEVYAPTLTWTEPSMSPRNTNNYAYDYQYRVEISNYSSYIYTSPLIDGTSFTIPANIWRIVSAIGAGTFYWSVITYEQNEPVSGGYYSQINPIVIDRHYNRENLSIAANNRYTEDVASIVAGYCYDYRITFASACNRVIQTFGTKDTVLELYASDGTLLLSQGQTDDAGYGLNALLSYEFDANKVYTVRVRFYSSSANGTTKLVIVPTYPHEKYEGAYGPYGDTTVSWSLSLNRVALFRFKFDTAGEVTFIMSSDYDTYLYIIDPRSTETIVNSTGSNGEAACLYNDDSGGNLQAKVVKTVEANMEYLVFISFYNPSNTTGAFSISCEYNES